MIGPPCPTCDRIHATGDVRAVGRFTDLPPLYVTPDGAGFSTREAAREWLCEKNRASP